MSRLRPTHRLTAERFGPVECNSDGDCPEGATCEDGVCVDDYNQPIEAEQAVVEDRPVRYHDTGTELTRSEAGQDVTHNPAIVGKPALVDELEPGDTITLAPIAGGDPIDDLEVVGGPTAAYGRRSRPTATHIELERT